jgi:Flp pilus assembly protein TadB
MNVQSSMILIVLLALAGLGAIAAQRILALRAASHGSESQRGLRGLNQGFRQRPEIHDQDGDSDELEKYLSVAEKAHGRDGAESPNSLQVRLRCAELSAVPVYVVGIVQITLSLGAFVLARIYLKEALQVASLFTGPLVVNWFINRRIKARVARFNSDFPQFLLSVVGMLKTGLNPSQALQSAAENLEIDSLVRQEVELMLERFRMGVPEDRSIGSFGEDIPQPEIELFVQALILSRRVGGNLSETLDRLAKQVRKRHVFTLAAESTVSMQRGSVWVIIVIMIALQLYMFNVLPEMVTGPWIHPKLAGYTQGTLVVIGVAILWMRKITNIKI